MQFRASRLPEKRRGQKHNIVLSLVAALGLACVIGLGPSVAKASIISLNSLTLVATVHTQGEYDNAGLATWNGSPVSPTNQPTALQDQLNATWGFYVDPGETNRLYIVVGNVTDTEYGYASGEVFDLIALTGFNFSVKIPSNKSAAIFSNQFAVPGEALLGPVAGSSTPLDSTPGWSLVSVFGAADQLDYEIDAATVDDAFTHFGSVYGATRINGGGVFVLNFSPSIDLFHAHWDTLNATASNGEGAYQEKGTLYFAFRAPEASSAASLLVGLLGIGVITGIKKKKS